MKYCSAALAVGLLAAATAQAHFLWLLPGQPGDKTTVQLIFSDSLQPDDAELLKKIVQTELFVRGADGATTPLKKYTEGQTGAYGADVTGSGPRVVGAVCRYGVIQRGQSEPFLLHYNARTHIGGVPGKETVIQQGLDRLDLDIVPLLKKPAVQVRWKGKPLADAEVVLLVPGVEKPVEAKTDAEGTIAIDPPKASGLYGIRARHIEKKEGELDGKKYKEARHYATLVLRVHSDAPKGAAPVEKPAALPADPTATRLLTDARAARAQWDSFPGFTADLEVYADGKPCKGVVQLGPKGDVTVKLDEPTAEAWVRRTFSSIAGHRLDNSAAKETPCAFLDQDMANPLGRSIRVLNDEFHSSYRVRDRQIIVVNRQMGDARFTITVMENRLNEEQKFLPACYVVNTWDLKTDALRSSETHHNTWKRIGKYDLPSTVTVVKATAGQLDARSIKLSNYKLLP